MGLFSSSPRFSPASDVPDLTGKVAFVSGANSGIGYQTALYIALAGAKVYLGARSEAKGLAAIEEMEASHPTLKGSGRVVAFKLDLTTIVGVKKDILKFLDLEERLDILVNNAGVSQSAYNIGQEGIESAFVVNLLSQYVITTTLLPLLTKTSELKDSDVRIVTVASSAHEMVQEVPTYDSVEAFNSKCVPKGADPDSFLNRIRRYGMSKLADILFAKELQRRLLATPSSSSILSLSLHPGLVSTGPVQQIFWFVNWFNRFYALTPIEGSAASLFAATSPEVRKEEEKYRGAFLGPFGVIMEPSKLAKDGELGKTLWETSERVVYDTLKKGGN